MPFKQDRRHSSGGTPEQPVSPNNCLVCSIKNLLAYYGHAPTTVDHCIQTLLTTEAKAPRNQDCAPTYVLADAVELNQAFVLDCLTNPQHGLNMRIDRYHLSDMQEILSAINQRLPILVCALGGHPHDSHTVATDAPKQGHDLFGDHTYAVVPDRAHAGQWLVLDPGKKTPTRLSTRQLQHNLSTMFTEQSLYCVIRKPPDEARIQAYSTGMKNDHQTSVAKAETVSPINPQTTAPPKADNSTGKPNPKPDMFSRFSHWIGRQWTQLTNACKRFGQWLKQLFAFRQI